LQHKHENKQDEGRQIDHELISHSSPNSVGALALLKKCALSFIELMQSMIGTIKFVFAMFVAPPRVSLQSTRTAP